MFYCPAIDSPWHYFGICFQIRQLICDSGRGEKCKTVRLKDNWFCMVYMSCFLFKWVITIRDTGKYELKDFLPLFTTCKDGDHNKPVSLCIVASENQSFTCCSHYSQIYLIFTYHCIVFAWTHELFYHPNEPFLGEGHTPTDSPDLLSKGISCQSLLTISCVSHPAVTMEAGR